MIGPRPRILPRSAPARPPPARRAILLLRAAERMMPAMGEWWVQQALQAAGYVYLFSWVFWVIFSICLHELAHGWTAIAQGDDTPVALGHMTMNPLVHMGPISLLVFALIGIAWGQMPVTPSRFVEGRLGEAKVAAAGPAMNLLLALAALTALGTLDALAGPRNSAAIVTHARTFLIAGGVLNLALMFLNLLPLLPLDGSSVLAGLSPAAARFYAREGVDRACLLGLVVVFWFGGRYLWAAAWTASYLWRDFIFGALT